eukprot:TRINITY_DN10910_c0_g1_i1.p1 TRINITY_DN10910_c0_g1~~TRINITY_DN10910_c0_g1_i1.p1  ORF type:complete len:188 (+),score=23.22 TRINITY_DN10910_c0_g1_i1:46-609(+)
MLPNKKIYMKQEGESILYDCKDIWISICKYLPERDICHLSKVNKRLNTIINKSSLIWGHINRDDTIKNTYSRNMIDNKDRYRIMEDYWHGEKDCEEKREYLTKRFNKENIQLVSSSEMKYIRRLGMMEKVISWMLVFSPTMLLSFVTMLEFKFLGDLKINHLFCFLPSLLYFFFSSMYQWFISFQME